MSSLLGTMAGHLGIFVAEQPALVRILLGVKIVNWRHRRGKGKGRNLQDSKEGKLGVSSDPSLFV